MNKLAALLIAAILLLGCSSNPSESEIKDLLGGNRNNDVFRVDNFSKVDGFAKDSNIYVADVKFLVVAKCDSTVARNMMNENKLSSAYGPIIDDFLLLLSFKNNVFNPLKNFEKGSAWSVAYKVTLIKKESGWSIENIKCTAWEEIVTKQQEEAKALLAQKKAELQKQRTEQAEAESREKEAKAKALKEAELAVVNHFIATKDELLGHYVDGFGELWIKGISKSEITFVVYIRELSWTSDVISLPLNYHWFSGNLIVYAGNSSDPFNGTIRLGAGNTRDSKMNLDSSIYSGGSITVDFSCDEVTKLGYTKGECTKETGKGFTRRYHFNVKKKK